MLIQPVEHWCQWSILDHPENWFEQSPLMTHCISPQCVTFFIFLSADMVLPPAYPPPPVPHVRKSPFSEARAHSYSGKPSAPVPPPPPKRSLPEIKLEPPPVPPLPVFKKPASGKECHPLPPEPAPPAPVLAPPEACEKLKTLNLSPRTPPPLPANKPKLSQLAEKLAEPKVPREHGKPGLFVPPVLPKPPVPSHQPPAVKPRTEKSLGPQLQ